MSTADDSLYRACFDGFKHRILELANENNVNYVHPKFGDTPLHEACKQGWLDIVEILIEKYGCDPLVVTQNNLSLLHCACRYGHIDVVTLLIEEYGCDPNVVTKSNRSLLHYACRYGYIDVVMLLIETYGCDPNVVTESNQSLLHYACGSGNLEVVKYLVNKQHLNPFMRDNINQSEPLDYAINYNKYSIAVYLCQHCISSEEMLSPNRIKTTMNLIKFILSTDTRVHSNDNSIWKTADGDKIFQLVGSSNTCIAHMSSALILQILDFYNTNCMIAYFKPDLRTADGDSILEVVCQSRRVVSQISSAVLMKWLSNSTDLMRIIIDTLERNTADGNNLLEVICQSEKCLIQISSTVFLKWLSGKSILGSMSIALPDCKTADGDTLLQLILQSEMSISRISSWLLAKLLYYTRMTTVKEMKNVNPNWKTVDGALFPHVLCLSNIENSKVAELMQYYILENGWNPDTFDGKGNTVLHTACLTNKFALVSYLIDQVQCNPNIKNYKQSLPVDMTTSLEVIDCLCRHDPVSIPSKTIIKWLKNPMIDDATMLCILQSLVGNHKTITKDGSTLLHVVCRCSILSHNKNLISLVDYLLTECQCDPNCLDSKQRMPLQLISDSEIMQVLVEHGAKVTTDVVFKVISSAQVIESGAELFALSSKKGTMLWCPTDLNGDGYTALHLACKADNFNIVNFFTLCSSL